METTTQSLAFQQLSNYAKQHAITEYGQPSDGQQGSQRDSAKGFHRGEQRRQVRTADLADQGAKANAI